MQRKLLRGAPALPALLIGSWAQAGWQLNMPRGVTDISDQVYNLHMLTLWVCVIIGVLVFGVMFYSMFKHRRSKGAESASFHESTKVELAWTLIPAAVIFGIGVKATYVLADMYNVDDAEMTVEIVGYQWRWRYRYLSDDPDTEVTFFSNMETDWDEINNLVDKENNYLLDVDEPMVLPTNTKVRFILTSADVIHSWWVPQLAVKKDAVPGIANEAWTIINEPGTYRGQCTELCGKDHGFMPVVVEAVTPEEFDQWLAVKQDEARQLAELTNRDWTMEDLMERGQAAYNSNCASCHQADGSGNPPTFPSLRGNEFVASGMDNVIDIILNGRRGSMMPAFRDQLGEVDTAAIATYVRNAWGNDMGDMVTPVEILEIKAGQ